LTADNGRPVSINRLTQFHEDPVVIAWWQARLGTALTWCTPGRRRTALAIAAVVAGVIRPVREMGRADDLPVPSDWLGLASLVLALFAILWLVYQAAAHFRSLPASVRRHPQISLHLLYWGGLALLWLTVPTAGAWRELLLGIAIIFPYLIWRCGYLLLSGQYGRAASTRFVDQLIPLWPAFGGSNTPYGKGLDYLSKCEARSDEELARSQLAGIKLVILGLLWDAAMTLMERTFYGPENAIPRLDQLVAQGGQAPFLASWASLYCELVWQVLRHAAHGHMIIGTLRLFGFNVFRNTYKPLLSESILEFWNRYYYYFKELMANFFFLPTFTQLGTRLRNWPRLRLLAAVFAAAFVGNMYYHLLNMETLVAQGYVFEAVYTLRSRFFYCFLLAIGIYVSMRRQQSRGGKPLAAGHLARIGRIFGVWTFFALIFIWNVRSSTPFLARVEFFLSLFGFA
jgi:hypothetical protein